VTDKINPISRDWAIVAQHCHTRIRELTEELVGTGHTHSEATDMSRRERIEELRQVLALAERNPLNSP
jgi:hypothetical protein